MSARSGYIDNLLQSGGSQRKYSRGRSRTRRRRRKRRQKGGGPKLKLAGKLAGKMAGKLLALAGKNANKGLGILSKNIKKKKIKAALNSSIVKSIVDKGGNYAQKKGAQWGSGFLNDWHTRYKSSGNWSNFPHI